MTMEENERATIHRRGYMNSTDHSQQQLDIKIYFLRFCQPMLLTSVL
jgi:hypothetical protein